MRWRSEVRFSARRESPIRVVWEVQFQRGYGATVARLTPDQKVGSSNLSALIFKELAKPNGGLRGGRRDLIQVSRFE